MNVLISDEATNPLRVAIIGAGPAGEEQGGVGRHDRQWGLPV